MAADAIVIFLTPQVLLEPRQEWWCVLTRRMTASLDSLGRGMSEWLGSGWPGEGSSFSGGSSSELAPFGPPLSGNTSTIPGTAETPSLPSFRLGSCSSRGAFFLCWIVQLHSVFGWLSWRRRWSL